MQYCPLFLRVATLLVVICINGFAHAGALTPFNKNDVPLADESLVDSGSAIFPKGVCHPFDYSLFYENIKENAKQRIETFTTRKQ